MKGPIEPHLQFAIRTLSSQNQQSQQNLQKARETASSSGSAITPVFSWAHYIPKLDRNKKKYFSWPLRSIRSTPPSFSLSLKPLNMLARWQWHGCGIFTSFRQWEFNLKQAVTDLYYCLLQDVNHDDGCEQFASPPGWCRTKMLMSMSWVVKFCTDSSVLSLLAFRIFRFHLIMLANWTSTNIVLNFHYMWNPFWLLQRRLGASWIILVLEKDQKCDNLSWASFSHAEWLPRYDGGSDWSTAQCQDHFQLSTRSESAEEDWISEVGVCLQEDVLLVGMQCLSSSCSTWLNMRT